MRAGRNVRAPEIPRNLGPSVAVEACRRAALAAALALAMAMAVHAAVHVHHAARARGPRRGPGNVIRRRGHAGLVAAAAAKVDGGAGRVGQLHAVPVLARATQVVLLWHPKFSRTKITTDLDLYNPLKNCT